MTEQRTKADEHWASRGLVAMLLREFKDFKAAAEIESGSSDVFSLCERDIAEKVAAVEKDKSVVAALGLQQILDNARAEVEELNDGKNKFLEASPKKMKSRALRYRSDSHLLPALKQESRFSGSSILSVLNTFNPNVTFAT